MFTRSFITFCLLLAISSCDKSQESALGPIPPAILALIDKNSTCNCEPYIDQYEWKGQAVYVSSCKGPACLCGALFYDAEGNTIAQAQPLSLNTFRQEAHFVRNVWTCTL